MLTLVARRIKLSYNVLNLRNLHCRPSEQCQTINHANDESDHSKWFVSKRIRSRCEWDIRGRNPGINTKIVSQTFSDHCWWKSVVSRHFGTTAKGLLPQNPNNVGKTETETIVLRCLGGDSDWKSSDDQFILKRYGTHKKRKHCNCEFLNYNWRILKWTTGFLGSFYASKLMCLYARRRRNYRQWMLMEQALAERQKIQKNVLEKEFGISKLQRSHVPADKHAFIWSEIPASFSYETIPVLNDHDCKENKATIGTQTTDTLNVQEPTEYGLNAAIGNLKSTLGHWEFKLGVRSLKMNRPEVAISHFILASIHNHPEATYNLGVCYEKGIGTSLNLNRAMNCYRVAANLGHAKSMYNLAVFFAQGKGGLKKDRKAAKDLFKAASRLGCKEAKSALGIRCMRPNDASQILTEKSYEIRSELSPAHRAGLSVVV